MLSLCVCVVGSMFAANRVVVVLAKVLHLCLFSQTFVCIRYADVQ